MSPADTRTLYFPFESVRPTSRPDTFERMETPSINVACTSLTVPLTVISFPLAADLVTEDDGRLSGAETVVRLLQGAVCPLRYE